MERPGGPAGYRTAANVVYEVPKTQRPGFLPRIVGSVTLPLIVGVGLPATTVLQKFGGKLLNGVLASGLGWALEVTDPEPEAGAGTGPPPAR